MFRINQSLSASLVLVFCLISGASRTAETPFKKEDAPAEGNSGPFKRESKPVKDDSEEELPPPVKSPEKAPAKKVEEPPKVDARASCLQCMGTGFVPSNPKPYVHLPSDPLVAANAVPWKGCPKCNAALTADDLARTEADRISKAPDQLDKWQQRLGMKFLSVETHHVTILSQLPPDQTKAVGLALEQLTAHVQAATKVTVLTPARPDTQEMLLLTGQDNFNKYIDVVAAGRPAEEVALARKCISLTNRKVSVMYPNPTPMEDKAVFAMAKMMMAESFGDAKAPDWLTEGFASYCENAVTKKNLCYSIAYEVNQVKFGQNWNADVAKLAREGQLRKWDEVFLLSMIGLKAREYITCYSIVSFLIKLDGQKFARAVVNMREGMDSQKAIEKSYGRRIADLQTAWAAWCLTLK